eukprot:PhM_4_TR1423/c0_g1_i1/m.66687
MINVEDLLHIRNISPQYQQQHDVDESNNNEDGSPQRTTYRHVPDSTTSSSSSSSSNSSNDDDIDVEEEDEFDCALREAIEIHKRNSKSEHNETDEQTFDFVDVAVVAGDDNDAEVEERESAVSLSDFETKYIVDTEATLSGPDPTTSPALMSVLKKRLEMMMITMEGSDHNKKENDGEDFSLPPADEEIMRRDLLDITVNDLSKKVDKLDAGMTMKEDDIEPVEAPPTTMDQTVVAVPEESPFSQSVSAKNFEDMQKALQSILGKYA